MPKLLPQEYVARIILPIVRGYVASCLRSRGVSQHRVARLLGVTQPMVYKYCRHDPDYYLMELEKLGVPLGAAKLVLSDVCRRINDDLNSLALAANTLASETTYCNRIKPSCDQVLCRGKTLFEEAYWIALNRILNIENLYKIIPEVGSNLAFAPKNARNLNEVIGLDGRIIKTRPRGVIPAGRPVLGGSGHTGRVALKYSNRWNEDAWAFAVKASVVNENIADEDVVVDYENGEGKEPIAYLVSRDPLKLVEAIEGLAHSLEPS